MSHNTIHHQSLHLRWFLACNWFHACFTCGVKFLEDIYCYACYLVGLVVIT